MNKDELVTNIKQWITLDEEIKNLQREIKKKRNEKKENTETLVRIMRDNEIDCFELDSNGGKLIYTKQKIKKSRVDYINTYMDVILQLLDENWV